MDKPGLLELGDEIKGVTFVPLEVTTDDASLIDGVYDYDSATVQHTRKGLFKR